jgi:polynucleotide 5'-hydroxyl-kinase GRC3/NOL9
MNAGLDRLILPEDWKKVVSEIEDSAFKIILILGASDTGKTTFLRYLVNELTKKGERIGLVDSDVGQSDIGPPTTIGLGIVEVPFEDFESIPVVSLYFVGSVSPEKHLLQTVVGTKKMVDKALSLKVDRVVIDTTGLVSGGVGRALKLHKIEIVSPSCIIALQRGFELEHILRSITNLKINRIFRLKVGTCVRRKSQEIRSLHRMKKFVKYFQDSEIREFNFDQINFTRADFGIGRRLTSRELDLLSKELDDLVIYGERLSDGLFLVLPERAPEGKIWALQSKIKGYIVQSTQEYFKDILTALLDESGEVLCLGIIESIDFGRHLLRLKVPKISSEARMIQFSNYKLKL